MRQLPQILRDPEAKEVFLKEGAREAVRTLHRPSPDEALAAASLEDLAGELTKRIYDMSYREFGQLKGDLNSDVNNILVQARDLLVDLCRDIASD